MKTTHLYSILSFLFLFMLGCSEDSPKNNPIINEYPEDVFYGTLFNDIDKSTKYCLVSGNKMQQWNFKGDTVNIYEFLFSPERQTVGTTVLESLQVLDTFFYKVIFYYKDCYVFDRYPQDETISQKAKNYIVDTCYYFQRTLWKQDIYGFSIIRDLFFNGTNLTGDETYVGEFDIGYERFWNHTCWSLYKTPPLNLIY